MTAAVSRARNLQGFGGCLDVLLELALVELAGLLVELAGLLVELAGCLLFDRTRNTAAAEQEVATAVSQFGFKQRTASLDDSIGCLRGGLVRRGRGSVGTQQRETETETETETESAETGRRCCQATRRTG